MKLYRKFLFFVFIYLIDGNDLKIGGPLLVHGGLRNFFSSGSGSSPGFELDIKSQGMQSDDSHFLLEQPKGRVLYLITFKPGVECSSVKVDGIEVWKDSGSSSEYVNPRKVAFYKSNKLVGIYFGGVPTYYKKAGDKWEIYDPKKKSTTNSTSGGITGTSGNGTGQPSSGTPPSDGTSKTSGGDGSGQQATTPPDNQHSETYTGGDSGDGSQVVTPPAGGARATGGDILGVTTPSAGGLLVTTPATNLSEPSPASADSGTDKSPEENEESEEAENGEGSASCTPPANGGTGADVSSGGGTEASGYTGADGNATHTTEKTVDESGTRDSGTGTGGFTETASYNTGKGATTGSLSLEDASTPAAKTPNSDESASKQSEGDGSTPLATTNEAQSSTDLFNSSSTAELKLFKDDGNGNPVEMQSTDFDKRDVAGDDTYKVKESVKCVLVKIDDKDVWKKGDNDLNEPKYVSYNDTFDSVTVSNDKKSVYYRKDTKSAEWKYVSILDKTNQTSCGQTSGTPKSTDVCATYTKQDEEFGVAFA
ncbi:hypothetical protein MACJ_002449 [Theileria orientalis]|uniref:SfiI-subtelomeric related protein family member n=1 Tax=Theileria orientalis TaxID=68886 RepID=A0A976QSC2_THEOR|nr:hypothetical protein MACJ_002449 [Theileria orientalis]